MILKKDGVAANLSIPNQKELGPGLLRGQVRKAGVSVEEFIEALSS
jgi:hypothetical protein